MNADPQVPQASDEQRRHPRVDIFREIACEADGVACRSQVADVSVGGMFIDLPRPPFKGGTRVRVCFTLSEGQPPIVTSALVHYVQDGIGMGIRFLELSQDDRERIVEAIHTICYLRATTSAVS